MTTSDVAGNRESPFRGLEIIVMVTKDGDAKADYKRCGLIFSLEAVLERWTMLQSHPENDPDFLACY